VSVGLGRTVILPEIYLEVKILDVEI